MLVVEVDGGQHAENHDDKSLDTFMRNEGYRVMRFWNSDVPANCDGVLSTILQNLMRDPL